MFTLANNSSVTKIFKINKLINNFKDYARLYSENPNRNENNHNKAIVIQKVDEPKEDFIKQKALEFKKILFDSKETYKDKYNYLTFAWHKIHEAKVKKIINQIAYKMQKDYEANMATCITESINSSKSEMQSYLNNVKSGFENNINKMSTDELLILKSNMNSEIKRIIENSSKYFKENMIKYSKIITRRTLLGIKKRLLFKNKEFYKKFSSIIKNELENYTNKLHNDFNLMLRELTNKAKENLDGILSDYKKTYINDLEFININYENNIKSRLKLLENDSITNILLELESIEKNLNERITSESDVKLKLLIDKLDFEFQYFLNEAIKKVECFANEKNADIEKNVAELFNDEIIQTEKFIHDMHKKVTDKIEITTTESATEIEAKKNGIIQNIEEKHKTAIDQIEAKSQNIKSKLTKNAMLGAAIIALIWLVILIALELYICFSLNKKINKISDQFIEYDTFEKNIDETEELKNNLEYLVEENKGIIRLKNILGLLVRVRILLVIMFYNRLESENIDKLLFGTALLAKNQYTIALKVFDDLLEEEKNDAFIFPEAYYGKAYAYFKMGEWDNAEKCIKLAVENLKDSRNSWSYKGFIRVVNNIIIGKDYKIKQDKIRYLEAEIEMAKAVSDNYKIEQNVIKILTKYEPLLKLSDNPSDIEKIIAINAFRKVGYIYYDSGLEDRAAKFKDSLNKAKKIMKTISTSRVAEDHPLRKEIELAVLWSEYCAHAKNDTSRESIINYLKENSSKLNNIFTVVEGVCKELKINLSDYITLPRINAVSDRHCALVTQHYENNSKEDLRINNEIWSSRTLTLKNNNNMKLECYEKENGSTSIIAFKDNLDFFKQWIAMMTNNKKNKERVYTDSRLLLADNNICNQNKIILTGFGFGAIIAEMFFYSMMDQDPNRDIELVTFNSAGSKPYIENLFSKDIHYSEIKKLNNAVTYLSAPDTTNTHAKQSVRTIHLDIKYSYDFTTFNNLRNYFISVLPTWFEVKSEREVYKFGINDFVNAFDETTGVPRQNKVDDCLKDEDYPKEAKRWPTTAQELNTYVDIEAMLAKNNKKITDLPIHNIEQQVKLDSCYRAELIEKGKIPIHEFTPEMMMYLRSYVHSNAAIDKNADHSILKYSIYKDCVKFHSNISNSQFKRYIQSRVRAIDKNDLYNIEVYKNKAFQDKFQFFATKNQLLSDEQKNLGLSTIAHPYVKGK